MGTRVITSRPTYASPSSLGIINAVHIAAAWLLVNEVISTSSTLLPLVVTSLTTLRTEQTPGFFGRDFRADVVFVAAGCVEHVGHLVLTDTTVIGGSAFAVLPAGKILINGEGCKSGGSKKSTASSEDWKARHGEVGNSSEASNDGCQGRLLYALGLRCPSLTSQVLPT